MEILRGKKMTDSDKKLSNYESELLDLKYNQLHYFSISLLIIGGLLLISNFIRSRQLNSFLSFYIHVSTYAIICLSFVPPFSRNYLMKRLVHFPLLSITGIVILIYNGNAGIGYMVILVSVIYTLYFFNKKVAIIYIIAMSAIIFLIVAMWANGYLVVLIEPSPVVKWTRLINKPILFMLIIFQLFYFFNYHHEKLKSSFQEIKKAYEDLIKEKQATSDYLDSVPALFFLYDENWELIRWNEGHKTMTGFNDDELYRKKALSWFEGEDLDKIRRAMSKVVVEGEAAAEVNMVRKDGTKFPIALTGRKIFVKNKQYVCGLGIDITEKKRLEQEVLQAQKMEALGTIAGGIAHDLNNVLGGLIGFSDIIREDVEDHQLPRIEYIDNIINAGERAVGIVRQILMFSRKTDIKKLPVKLKSVTRDVIKLIERTIPKSITIEQDLVDNGYTILADMNQMHQVLMNLCTNAWHSMRKKGGILSVKLKSREVKNSDIPDDKNCIPGIYEVIKISDTGTGIAHETLSSIFEPFFTTKPEGEGTGLGLAVVKRIIESHEGFITVKSEVGKGTVFSIFLPVSDQELVYSNLDAKEKLPGGHETILVVEDEPQLREATIVALDRLGYNVLSAEDGIEGLKRFESHKKDISLVLTDLAMPRMTGFEMSKEIKNINPDLPVILCTGFSESFDKEDIPEGFFDVCLNKPIRKKKIAGIIRKVLNGETVTDEELDV